MDTFMEYYFEGVFSNMDRDCLNERLKRRELVEYFSTVIAGCARGDILILYSFDDCILNIVKQFIVGLSQPILRLSFLHQLNLYIVDLYGGILNYIYWFLWPTFSVKNIKSNRFAQKK